MRHSPRNLRLACDHKGLTHFGGVYFFREFLGVLQFRNFLARQLTYPRRNRRYSLSQMILALVYPLVLGLDRLETVSFLRSNGTFQYLTGLQSFPDPQTLRRFLLHAPDSFLQQMHRMNDRLLQNFIHLPDHRSRWIFDLDSSVVTVFGRQERAEVGYNPRYRGKRSYHPLLCVEANSSYLWDTELRPGNAGTWDGSVELMATCFLNVPRDIRELRVRADAGFGFHPVLEILETRGAQYAVVARLTQAFKRLLPGLHYESVNQEWEMAEFAYRPHGWPQARRFVQIHSRRRTAKHAVYPGTLRVSRLGDQPGSDAIRDLALLRRACRHRTAHLRIAGGLCLWQDSHRVICGQRLIPGNRSPGL